MKFLFLVALSIPSLAMANFVHLTQGPNGEHQIFITTEGSSSVLSKTDEKIVLYPDISVDGDQLVYIIGENHNDLQIKYTDLKNNSSKLFGFSHKSRMLHPQMSGNGKHLFFSAQDNQGVSRIYTFPMKEKLIQHQNDQVISLDDSFNLSEGEVAYFPRPSSDGNFLVYQRNTGALKEIIFMDRVFNIKEVIAEGMSPALSFDERYVAYSKIIDGQYEIFKYDRVLKTHTQVTFDKNNQMAPTFRPDNTLVFASQESGLFKIYEIRDGKWKQLIASHELSFYSPHFTGETKFKQNEKAPFIGEARSSFGTISYKGKVYMSGGHSGAEHTYPPESFQDTFAVYDIASNKWTELAPRPVKAHGYQILAHNDYIYAFGGFTFSAEHKPGWKSLSQIDRYSISSNKWETVAHLNEARSSNIVVAIDDKAYVVGGWNSTPKHHNDYEGKFHTRIEIFDLITHKVEFSPYELDHKRRAFTGLAYKDQILMVGGLSEGSTHFELRDKVTLFNPRNGEIKELPNLPFATFAPAAEMIGNELFVFGGMYQTGPTHYEYVSHIYGMDLSEKKWRHTGRYLQETKGFSQVFPLDEKTLGILGGHRYFQGFDSPVRTFETFSK